MKRSKKVTVTLAQSPDYYYLYDVVDMSCDLQPVESCSIMGLMKCNTLEIGSWITKSELKLGKGLRSHNTHIIFVIL